MDFGLHLEFFVLLLSVCLEKKCAPVARLITIRHVGEITIIDHIMWNPDHIRPRTT